MKRERILYYDLLNISACICVIALHVNGIVHQYSNTAAWKQALIIEVMCYWAVPVFFMLTGATLMSYREKYDTKTFFKKRLLRTAIPLLLWDIIFLIWKCSTGQMSLEGIGVKKLISLFLNNEIMSVYWYFIPLYSIYLSMPVLTLLKEKRTELKRYPLKGSNKIFIYMVIVSFLLYSLFPCIAQLLGVQWNGGFQLPVCAGYLMFVLLGYLLSEMELKVRYRIYIWSLGVFGAVFRYAYVYVTSIKEGDKNPILFNYMYFPSVLLAVAIFVLFKYIPWKKILKSEKIQNVIGYISSCSLGIYLIHMFVLYYVKIISGLSTDRLLWRIGCIPVIYIVSLAVIFILKKIPVLNRLLVP